MAQKVDLLAQKLQKTPREVNASLLEAAYNLATNHTKPNATALIALIKSRMPEFANPEIEDKEFKIILDPRIKQWAK